MGFKNVHFVVASIAIAVFIIVSVQETSSAAINSTTNAPIQDIPLSANKSVPLLIRCYCNLPKCLESGHNTCVTRQGCFSELQPTLSDFQTYYNCTTNNMTSTQCFTSTTSSTPTVTTQSPILDDQTRTNEKLIRRNPSMNGSYGCLDMISVTMTCNEIIKSVEKKNSEFPKLQKLKFDATENRIRVHRCCQKDMCNNRFNTTEIPKAIQAAVIVAYTNSIHLLENKHKKLSNYTVFSQKESRFIKPLTSKRIEQKLINIFMDILENNHLVISRPFVNSGTVPLPKRVVRKAPEGSFDNVDFSVENTSTTLNTTIETIPLSLSKEDQPFIGNKVMHLIDNNATEIIATIPSINNATSNDIATTPATFYNTIAESNVTTLAYTDNVTTATIGNLNNKSTIINDDSDILAHYNNTTVDSINITNTTYYSNTFTASNDTDYSEINTNTADNNYVNISSVSNETNYSEINANTDNNYTTTATIENIPEYPNKIVNKIEIYSNTESNANATDITIKISENTTPSGAIIENVTSVYTGTTEKNDTADVIKTMLSTNVTFNTNEMANVISTTYSTKSEIEIETNDIEIDDINSGSSPHVRNRRHDNISASVLQQQPEKGVESTSVMISQEDLARTLLQDNAPLEFPIDREQDDTFHRQTERSPKIEQQQLPAYLQDFRDWIIKFTSILAVFGFIAVAIIVYTFYKVIRKTNDIGNYKGVCSNPGQPCPCRSTVDLLNATHQRRSRTDITAYRNKPADPVFPASAVSENTRGHGYTDSTGTTTYVYTKIPVLPTTPLGARRH